MKCKMCGREFEPGRSNGRYCSRRCYYRARQQKSAGDLEAQEWFKREWEQWRRDFANGLTVSNVRVKL